MKNNRMDWLFINVADFLAIATYGRIERLPVVLKALIRAAQIDRWTAVQGNFDPYLGHKVFTPENIWERRFWQGARQEQIRCYLDGRGYKGKHPLKSDADADKYF